MDREQAAHDLNKTFGDAVRPSAQRVEDRLSHSASRTIIALFHGLAAPSEIEPEYLRELQVLCQVNQETQDTLFIGKKRNEQLRLLLQQKEKHLAAQRIEVEREKLRNYELKSKR